MSTSVTLPALGESVTEGTVTRWLKQVGDTVAADEPLLEVSTDKVDTEIPSPAAGVLLEIKAAEDETVEVGAVLAVIGDADEQPSGDAGGDEQPAQTQEQQAQEQPAEEPRQQEPAEQQAEAEPPAEPQAEQTDTAAEEPQAEQEQQPQAEDDQPEQPTGGAQPSGSGQGTEVTLPALGESVTEGTVSRWLKQVGETVAADEALLEVSTDKVDTEIPSPTAGTLLEIRVKEDETVEVGAVLGVIGSADQASSDQAPAQPSQDEQPATEQEEPEQQPRRAEAPEPSSEADEPRDKPAQESAPAQSAPPQQAPAQQKAPEPSSAQVDGDGGPGYVTPLVRKLAAEHEVDLGSITGTGVGGRIRKQDVLAAAEAAKAPAAPAEQPAAEQPAAASAPAAAAVQPSSLRGTTEKMSRLRKIIAKRMVESLQTSAQLTTIVEVDLTVVSRLRAKVKNDFLAREGVKLSYLPFLIKAAVDALKVHPKLNATVDTEAEEITYPATENISIAVDTDKGLVVPVIKGAGDLSIAGLAKKIADVADRTRSNKLTPDDVTGGTFTVTNTGSRGALIDTPIVNMPQVAILGTGTLVKRPVVLTDKVLGETIAVRDMMYLSLSYDHRIVDGADAARFLGTLKERLEEGDFESEFGL
ncbi:2-oxoglutarate dehydrogenase, E2 component, dihydrolipoamide succinyltransferase [Microlunatus speluncae]|uniref:2-oxoglutarate dehydrogenase, E2 component, dihydrolipoamide succinyltransferase n=1 Tax=Microlunatus speluncae TaxID=2594267 RepID=UPI0012665BED|nr:2-oxoglutarate dehydrogenase, E2 component, dihydrolipoamide succinyltransferase [Microlunatus speluncae]